MLKPASLRSLLALSAALLATPIFALQADFESLTPTVPYGGPGGGAYEDGRNLDGSFSEGGITFNNSFTDFGEFTSWSGMGYSNTTDTVTEGFGNQWSAFPGSGNGGSSNYGLVTAQNATFTFDEGAAPLTGLWLTNTTYAALAMQNGDFFAKAFGGESGDDPDFFSVTLSGLDDQLQVVGTLEVFLADFRFADNSEDYILDEWIWVDTSAWGAITGIQFNFDSSDVGGFGINTPLYVAIDDIGIIPEPRAYALLLGLAVVGLTLVQRRLTLVQRRRG